MEPRTIGNLDLGEEMVPLACEAIGIMDCSGQAIVVDASPSSDMPTVIAKALAVGLDGEGEFLYRLRLRVENSTLRSLLTPITNGSAEKLLVTFKGKIMGITNNKPHSPKLWVAVTDLKVLSIQ